MNYLERLNKIYNVGIYIRLSREDDEKTYESESITNQKSLLLQYVEENNLRVYDIYVDDGYSGTNFDRPGFKRLINDIESKKINMVITKDMSRLGRDYIGTGNLIEKYLGCKLDVVLSNNKKIDEKLVNKYQTEEQKDPIILDKENINANVIEDFIYEIENGSIRHDSLKTAYLIFSYLMKDSEK